MNYGTSELSWGVRYLYKVETKKSDSNKPIQELECAQQDRRILSYKNSLPICF